MQYGLKRLGLAFCYMLIQVTRATQNFLTSLLDKDEITNLTGDRIPLPSSKLASQWEFPRDLVSPPLPPPPHLGEDRPLQVHLCLAPRRVCVHLLWVELCRTETGRLSGLERMCQRKSSQVMDTSHAFVWGCSKKEKNMPLSCFQFCMNGVKARKLMGFKGTVVPDDEDNLMMMTVMTIMAILRHCTLAFRL